MVYTYKYILLLIIGFLLTLRVLPQCGQDIDLNDWSAYGDITEGFWVINPAGDSLEQLSNTQRPVFFISDLDYFNVIIEGDIKVNTPIDDDIVGFVFGVKEPISIFPDTATVIDAYLFDWKQISQSHAGYLAKEGFGLSYINDTFDFSLTPPAPFWKIFFGKEIDSVSSPNSRFINSLYGNLGWEDSISYHFKLTYLADSIGIEIDNNVIFSESGCFEPGRFGFYCFSQQNVVFTNFSYKLVNNFKINPNPVCENLVTNISLTGGPCPFSSFINPGSSYSWDFGDGSPSANGVSNDHTYSAAGNYDVELIVTDTIGCMDTVKETIVVNPIPFINNPPTDFSYCNGSVVPVQNLTSVPSAGTFTWTNSNTSIGLAASGSGNIPSFTATNSGASPISGTISITPIVNGCVGSVSTYNITVNPTPTVSAPVNGSYCPSASVPSNTLTSNPTGGTFTWSNSNTAIGLAASGSGNIPSFTATNSGASPISGTISITPIVNGCVGSVSTYDITVNPTPTVSAPVNGSYCPSVSVPSNTLTSNPTGGTFTWSNSNTAIGLAASGSGNIPSFTATNTGVSSISGTITVTPTLNSCPGTPSNYTITVHPTPTVSLPANASYCPGDAVPASAFSSTPAGGTFTWTNSNTAIGLAASGSGNVPAFTATNAGATAISGTISVVPTVNSCPGNSTDYSITVDPEDDPSFSYPSATYCLTGTDPIATISGTTGGSFSISGTGSINSSNGTIDLSASGLGSYTVTYNTAPAGNPCPSLTTFNITITAAPSGGFSYDNPNYCQNATAPNLTFDPGASGGTFSATPTGLSINSSSGAIDLANSDPGIYKVYNTIAPAGGCAAALDSTSIEIFMVDSALFSYSSGTYCITGTDPVATLGANATTGGNFSISGTGIINGSNGTIDLDASELGPFTITYNTTPVGNPCPSSTTFNVTITAAPSGGFSYDSPNYCQNAAAPNLTFDPGASGGTFSANPSGIFFISTSTGEIDLINSLPGSYTVFNNLPATNGCAASTDSTSIIIDPSFSTPAADSICDGDSILLGGAFQSTAGTYYDTLNSINGCDSIIETSLSIVSPNSITPDPVPTICDVDDITLSATYSGNGTITWYDDPNGNNIIGTGNPITLTNSGTGVFTYYVSAVSFCSSNIQAVNVAIGGVDAIIDADPVVGEIPLEVNFNATNSMGNVSSFEWDFDGDDNNDDGNSITTNIYPDTGKFNVRLIVSDGVCYDTAFIIIDAFFQKSALIIPNVFTPNDDGYNDVFTVDGVNLQSVEGVIYNRWGQRMYSWNNVKGHWNGRTLAGSEAPDGTYFYIISAEGIDGEKHFKKGGFSLIR